MGSERGSGSRAPLRGGADRSGPGPARPFLRRRRAEGKEAARGGLAGAAGPGARPGSGGAAGRWVIEARRQRAAEDAALRGGFAEGRRADPGCSAARDGWEPAGFGGERV